MAYRTTVGQRLAESLLSDEVVAVFPLTWIPGSGWNSAPLMARHGQYRSVMRRWRATSAGWSRFADIRVNQALYACCPAGRSGLDAVPEVYHNPMAVWWWPCSFAVIGDQVDVVKPGRGLLGGQR
jgi:hypothetical protein